MNSLRPYQSAAVDGLRRSFAQGNRGPCLVVPTGGGKTIIARAVVESAVDKGNTVLFLAPRRELIYQTCEKLELVGIHYGVIMAGEGRDQFARVQVACVPTIYHRCVKRERMPLPKADVVIVDEAHLSISKMCRSVLEAYPQAVKIGLTATPARTDGTGLFTVYDDLVMGPTVADLTAQGWLVPARYYAPTKPDLEGVKLQAGDYNQKQLGHVMDEPQLVGDVVTNWLRIASDRKTVVFSVNVSHSMHLCEQFQAMGIKAEHLDGTTENEDRKAILSRVYSGETQVLCNCDVLTTGWDCPPISCAVLARPTKSIVRYFQMVGRVLRPFDGKDDCIVIDHSGAVDEIGFVDEPIEWSLDGSEKVQDRKAKSEHQEPKKITCGECATVFTKSRACPVCGTEIPAHVAKAIESRDADLVEVQRDKNRRNRQWSMDEKARFYGELKAYAGEHGYKIGWANHKYRERLGVWPNAVSKAPPVQPSPETRAWIKHKQIRYAKSKQKRAA